jgi:hypothetical protein
MRSGRPVNTAARVSDAGYGGQIVCTQQVHDLALKEIEKQRNATPKSKFIEINTIPENLSTPLADNSHLNHSPANNATTVQPSHSELDELVDINTIHFSDCGSVSLKGIGEPMQILSVTSPAISYRKFSPPLRIKSKAAAEGKDNNNRGSLVHEIAPNQAPLALSVSPHGSKIAASGKIRRSSIDNGKAR